MKKFIFILLIVSMLLMVVAAVTVSAAEPKVTICHIPPGNPPAQQTLVISVQAVSAHLAHHGDVIGECENG